MKKLLKYSLYAVLWGLLACLIAVGIGGVYVFKKGEEMYSQLPDLGPLLDYQPKIPLRIYSADGTLIGEFGEERRTFGKLAEFPESLKWAILTAEDERFYSHPGIDLQGIARAAYNNFQNKNKQGASTITQQVARNVFLTREQTYTRKAKEALLAIKIEKSLSKDQILEVYMNHMFLGQRAYGFAAASQIYFGKSPRDLTLAESAMLAGLPKAPTQFNPVNNPKRAAVRQKYILERMLKAGRISQADYEAAILEPLKLAASAQKPDVQRFGLDAPYVAEMARQYAVQAFGAGAYTLGLKIYTSISDAEQRTANESVRRAILNYEQQYEYRGPEEQVDIKGLDVINGEQTEFLTKLFGRHPIINGLKAALVYKVEPAGVSLLLEDGERVVLKESQFGFARGHLARTRPDDSRIKEGSILRLERLEEVKEKRDLYRISQIPLVQSAFVSADPSTGAIKALVGGVDFNSGKFNRATQAFRQPGSAFKPFIYAAAVQKGFAPSTIINDAPLVYMEEGMSEPWEPKNYDGKYAGPMSMRQGLATSKNMISARLVQAIGPQYAQQVAMQFGFEEEKTPAVLALSLGVGSVNMLQMLQGYGVFATGGHLVPPFVIERVQDNTGRTVYQVPLVALEATPLVVDPRVAYLMDSMLRDVAIRGTAAKASVALKRNDLAGKTGTTNNAVDAWFAGYHSKRVGVAWVGFDQPKTLGSRETGGGLALPIWIDYMRPILEGVPVEKRPVPEGILQSGGEWYLEEFGPGVAIESLGLVVEEEPKAEEVKEEGGTSSVEIPQIVSIPVPEPGLRTSGQTPSPVKPLTPLVNNTATPAVRSIQISNEPR